MATASFFEVLILALLPILSGGERIPDLLSLVDPQAALESLGQKTDEESLAKLIAAGGAGAGGSFDEKEATSAIQNLASSTESVRERARARLVAMGPAIRARLEDVAAKDTRRAEEAKKVLAELEATKSESAQRQEVLRSLAIRLAGEKSIARLLPAVREACGSKNPFVAQAAKDASALLEKADKTETAAPGAGPALSPAVEALPAATRVFVTFQLGYKPSKAGVPVRLDRIVRGVFSSLPLPIPAEQVDKSLRELTASILQFVLDYGNISLDRLCLANVGGVGPTGGGLGMIASGRYEREVLERGLEKNTAIWIVGEVEGRKIYTSIAGRLIPLDDQNVLFLPSEASRHFPLAEYLASFKAGKKALRAEARWEKFLATLGGSAVLRGLALTDSSLMSEIYKAMEGEADVKPEVQEAVKGMQEAEAEVAFVEGTKLRYRVEAAFAEGKQAQDLAAFLKETIQKGITEMEEMAAQINIAQIKAGIEVMKSIKVSSEGKKGVLRAEFDPIALFGPLLEPSFDSR